MAYAFTTTPIRRADAASGFTCGEPALDAFFRRHATGNHAKGIGTTFVLRGSAPGDASVLGFYTLSMASIEAAQLSTVLEGRLPRYPLPVALIGRLGIDARAQGRGLGTQLVADALLRIETAAVHVACVGAVVDAKDAAAEPFYKDKLGFVLIDDEAWPHRLFLAMSAIRSRA